MHDPFPLRPVPWLSRAVQPFADYVSFTTLHLHIHEIVLSFLLYSVVEIYLSPVVSTWLFPVRYSQFSAMKRKNWDAHVVSLVQSIIIVGLAIWVMYADEERKNMTWQQRVWGYTGAAGLVQSFATGYFVWDLFICLRYPNLFGVGMIVHAICALTVFSLSFVSHASFQFEQK